MPLEEIFVVNQINKDVTLGMSFLARHGCKIDFTRRELVCTDWFERLIVSRVQTIRKTFISPWMEVALSCCLTLHNHAPEGLFKGLSDRVVLANRPGAKGNMVMRCINSTNQLLQLAAGLTIGTFTSID